MDLEKSVMFSMYVSNEQTDWDENLLFTTAVYNTSKQASTGFIPFYLLHGRVSLAFGHANVSAAKWERKIVVRLQ